MRRNLSSKLIQIQYTDDQEVRHTVETREVSVEDQAQFSITDAETEELHHQLIESLI